MNPEIVAESTETKLFFRVVAGSDDLGFLTVDSLVGRGAGGGVRMTPDVDEEEVSELARAMTLKHGFLGLPVGGAKAGIRCDAGAPADERIHRLRLFGKAIAPLLRAGTFIPGSDMGTNFADVQHILQSAGVPIHRRDRADTATGYYTALTVFAGVKEAARQRNLSLAGCSVAIEGFGKVGQSVADLLIDAGARIVAISTVRGALYEPSGLDVQRLKALSVEADSRIVDLYDNAEKLTTTDLLELPVDLLCLCARRHSITSENAARVDARIIVPGANAPTTSEAGSLLAERGALLLPDFVTNCGGVLGASMEFAAFEREQIASFIDTRIAPRIAEILDESERTSQTPAGVATPKALMRMKQMQARAEAPGAHSRIARLGLGLYRRGLLPSNLVKTRLLEMLDRSPSPQSDQPGA